MILIELRDFRGCERASIRVDPIALVAGRNAAGKSSIAQAVGAALTGNALPLAGLTKGSAGLMVKVGAEAASVIVSGPEGMCRVDWPGCQVTARETPPQATQWAAGLDSVALLPAKERARVLGVYLHADPTREDLRAALADAGLGDDQVIATIAKMLEDHGWDGAHTLRRERGAEYKGRWRQVTGVNYGSRVAAAWCPKGWSDLEQASEADLLAALARAKDTHEAAIGAAAVSDAERDELACLAGEIDERRGLLQDCETAHRAAIEAYDAAKTARAALPPASAQAGVPCPYCQQPVAIRQVSLVETRLEKVEAVPAPELRRRRLAIADADGEISRLAGDRDIGSSNVEKARQQLRNAVEAQTRLAALRSKGKSSSGDVEAARAALAEAEARLTGFRRKREADDLHEKVKSNDRLIEILAPTGLRAKKLGQVLELFNAVCVRQAQAAGWKPVAIDAEMNLTYGGRPYGLLSTSEQYRVRATLQLAMAAIDKSRIVVIDAADVLDGPTRSGLFSLLDHEQIPALVCLTLSRREQLPDLAAAGLGNSYWLENGILEPLRPVAEEEAA